MKKRTITVVTLLCLLLYSCTAVSPSETTNSTYESGTSSSRENENPISPEIIYPIHYDSYNELKNAVSKENEEKIFSNFSETEETRGQLGKLKGFVERFRTQNIIVPCINGSAVELRNKEGFSNISLFVSDQYGLPWVYYYPYVSTGENFYIKMTYLPDDIAAPEKAPIASDVIKELSPGSPNIDNLGEQHEKIYNQKIKLGDREVTALVCKFKNDSRSSIAFVYHDILVEVKADPEVWNKEWFSELTFGRVDK